MAKIYGKHGWEEEPADWSDARVKEAVAKAVAAERERCAQIADAEADEARALFKEEPNDSYAAGILVSTAIAKSIRKPVR